MSLNILPTVPESTKIGLDKKKKRKRKKKKHHEKVCGKVFLVLLSLSLKLTE